MLFEDLDSLNEMIDLIRTGGAKESSASKGTRRYRDLNDPEIDRLYSTSPPESEQVGTFELDNALLNDYMDGDSDGQETTKSSPAADVITSKADDNINIKAEYEDLKNIFRRKEIVKSGDISSSPSCLSQLLNSTEGSKSGCGSAPASGVGISLTIYLPNKSPLSVEVDPSDTVDSAINTILNVDKASDSPSSSLHHHAPECYELRLHEGDGEPDEDFPALDRKRVLKQFGNVAEYCLCQKPGVAIPPEPSKKSLSKKASKRDDSLPADMIIVLLPNTGHTKLRLEPTTTAQDLIKLVSKTHRLKLYTVDYICSMSEEDQRRLQFYSRVLDPKVPILSFGIQKVELQQRVYADSSKLKPLKRMIRNDEGDSISMSKVDGNMLFTDITAAVYQEWNVIKQNKFGRMQERILGIDGNHLYNSRRLGKGNKNGVSHAVRDISTVVQVQNVSGDPCSFRVTFDDGREIYDIGYTCDTARECIEIIAKLRYLLAARSKAE